MIKLIECPRDAMQGIKTFIPTSKKIKYLNALLKVGFDTIDFGSFVSEKAIPQMKDTHTVIQEIDYKDSFSKLLAIVANKRGANDACKYEQIGYLGYPFSVSETFQLQNTNSTISESFQRVKDIQNICQENNKKLVVYLSMGFGNPYGDTYNESIIEKWIQRLSELGVAIFSISDTVGIATPEIISSVLKKTIPKFPEYEIGVHLHTAPHNWRGKLDAAYDSGCRRFDTAILGYGGCPMAQDKLIGNMPTESFINHFGSQNMGANFNMDAFENSMRIAKEIFNTY